MRKLVLITTIMLACWASAYAQKVTVSGKVLDSLGVPLVGASVREKGTNAGTSVGTDGIFNLTVKQGATLIISSAGYQEVVTPALDGMKVTMVAMSSNLEEVVVTALGVKREKRALGFSLQEVKGENLTIAKSVDVSSSLAGKVAGVQLVGSPSSTFDNANIIIRGVQGLNVNNPLFVVDGTPTDQSAVLMDNVENISVLKGQAAAALYGSRGQNGVVMITTRKGQRKKMTSVELNLGFSMENVAIIPAYQDQYAGGYSSAYTSKNSLGAGYLDDQGYYIFNYDPSVHPASWATFQGQRMLEYGADESWGPKIGGEMYRPYYSWYPGAEFGVLSPMTAQPDNVKDFFRTGTNLNNSVAFNAGGQDFSFRMVYGNQNRELTIPNAKRQQHQLNINGVYDIGNFVTISTDVAYTTHDTKGKPLEGYRLDGLNVTQNFSQWFQRQLDMKKMQEYRQPDGSLNSWNIGDPNFSSDPAVYGRPQYWDNPYFVVAENFGTQKHNRLVGNVGLNIKLNSHWNLQSYARMNSYSNENDQRVATGGLNQDGYSINQNQYKEMNYESNLMYKNKFGDFSVDGMVGGNHRTTNFSQLNMATDGGLSSANYFDIAASVARPLVSRGYQKSEVNSLYAKASFGWKNMLFVEGTVRNDWSSNLPESNNNYLYPSVSTSFIFTELLTSSVLTFGKLRASYASVGSDIPPHSLDLLINNGSFYGTNPSATIGNSFRGGNIKPSLTNAIELGLELKFWRRIGLDVAVYKNNNINQILNVDVTPASGFSSAQINAGDIVNKGIEISLTGAVIQKKNFQWDVMLNFAKNTNEINELAEGLTSVLYATRRYDIRLEHRVGEEWGTFYGRKWRTDPTTGKTIINASGQPEYDINQKIGTVLPEWTGGVFNTFKYKAFDLSFSIDWQKGGMFYSETRNFSTGTGLAAETVGLNDKGHDWRDYPGSYSAATGNTGMGGIRIPGQFADGKENNRYISARAFWYTARQRDATYQLLDASYVKLREIRFGYSIPSSFLQKTKIAKAANIGVMVQNAWLIWATTKDYGIDPSELESLGYEGGQLSATRQIGANLRITF